ncbi:MAG: YceI family protein [Bacteroidota bacterium]
MKTALKLSFLFALSMFLFACSSSAEKEVEAKEATDEAAAPAAAAAVYTVNTEMSTVNWTGGKVLDIGDKHNGTVKISEGSLAVEDGKLTAGNFTIDMTSMVNEDLPEEKKGDLIGHLKSEDFFAVEEYPTATFEITTVEAVENSTEMTHNITGNLTMHGETKQITIPANVAMEDGKITAVTPEFTIDRTEWNVMYGSDKLEGIAKDKVISNDLTLKIMLDASAS